MSKKTIYMSLKSFKPVLKELVKTKKTFTVSQTGYSSQIKGVDTTYDYVFSNGSNKKVLMLHSKIKSDVIKSDIHIDNIVTSRIKYFNISNINNCNFSDVWNIDISSAYPQQLYNFGFLKSETWKRLKQQKKSDRLRAIGMLATKKTISDYEKGVVNNPVRVVKNDYLRNVFFAVCNEIGEVIDRCRQACKSFVFFWFDGIYFTDYEDSVYVKSELEKSGFQYKELLLKKFEVKKTKRLLMVKYYKGKELKKFMFPLN